MDYSTPWRLALMFVFSLALAVWPWAVSWLNCLASALYLVPLWIALSLAAAEAACVRRVGFITRYLEPHGRLGREPGRSTAVYRVTAGMLFLASSCLGPGLAMAQDTPVFEDRAVQAGLRFTHYNGMSGAFYLPEIMGAGAALLDYDNDGDLDVYMVQGAMLGPGKTWKQASFPPPAGVPLTDRLLRNDTGRGASGEPVLRFTDVSRSAVLTANDYGMGVAVGDYDNDGWVDLYVTNFGRNRLLRNTGKGRFEDRTEQAGVGDASWSVSAAFLDYDRDGRLDLYVGNYVRVRLQGHTPCRAPSSAPDYCTPMAHEDQPDRLYRNLGGGRFQDVSTRAGLDAALGPALGVMDLDVNGDGWSDIYVANDAKPNHLWINNKKGGFSEDALFAGVAVNMEGAAEGSMGVAAGDYDNDGDEDLFMTHLTGETNTVFVNDGKGWFEDRSVVSGLGGPSKAYTGFGTGWLDYDNDGDLDLFVANGEVSVVRALGTGVSTYPLDQPDQLFENRSGRFLDASAVSGLTLRRTTIGRGAAFGDIDNDGDTDILVSNNSGPVKLLVNQVGQDAPWLGLDLRLRYGAPALGARLELGFRDASAQWRWVRSSGSYASASDSRVLLGLTGRPPVKRLVVHWPGGAVEGFAVPAAGAYHTLTQGRGKPVNPVKSNSH